MARVIKIDNALQKKYAYKKQKKQENKPVVVYFLIVCEGEKTEPNYFKGFPKQIGKVVYDIEFDGGGINTLKVVETAIELRNKSTQKYDRVWAVFDRDSFPPNLFNSAILKAAAHDIECAWSNEAFELWYLLHFQNRVTPMSREDYKKAIETAINEKIGRKKTRFKYKKNALDMFDVLNQYGNQEQAIKWARDLNNNFMGEDFANFNPSTQVFKLVEELIGKSLKLNEEITKKHINGD
jgi:RloB-like protein